LVSMIDAVKINVDNNYVVILKITYVKTTKAMEKDIRILISIYHKANYTSRFFWIPRVIYMPNVIFFHFLWIKRLINFPYTSIDKINKAPFFFSSLFESNLTIFVISKILNRTENFW
jgi:hypothetical protein